mmetsp:Transcript_5737/g.16618  ORF Transcript_5737/g.16618 Transcript_5737/m.16618 type:complete len:86 (+) Transcript_5737:800-1057(+)
MKELVCLRKWSIPGLCRFLQTSPMLAEAVLLKVVLDRLLLLAKLLLLCQQRNLKSKNRVKNQRKRSLTVPLTLYLKVLLVRELCH